MSRRSTVDPIETVFERYRAHGHRSYGESVSELEHALQCATIAEGAGEAALVIATCLLHDYGHLCHEHGEDIAERGEDARHEELGAAALAAWFRPELVEGVRLHVEAKRNLCFLDPRYAARLSPASATSLRLQGGPHSADEARAFGAGPHAALAVKVRRYDELAKQPGRKTPGLESFRAVLVACLLPSAASGALEA
jgi:phosphonate degradation associated HDIG domain protein